MKASAIVSALVMMLLLIQLPLMSACGGGGGDSPGETKASPSPTATMVTPGEPVTITIGNLTDMTGPASSGIDIVDKAIADSVRYFNDEDLIPGVRVELIAYDTTYDSTRNLPGYESLMKSGADLILTPMPSGAAPIRDRANADKTVVFTFGDTMAGLTPPGYVFCLGVVPEVESRTFLKWIAEKDWDWEANGPAKIGGAGWLDDYSPTFFTTAEAYCEAHPEQFEWIGGYLTDFGFSWAPQVESLKDADYVFSPTVATTFVKQYGDANGHGKLCMVDLQMAFLGIMLDAGVGEHLDGTLVLRSSRWWSEEGPLIDMAKELLYRNHPGSAEEMKHRGVGYLGVVYGYLVLDAIRQTVEEVGAQGFSSEALYETLQSFSVTVDGIQRYSFSPTKRDATNYYRMYEFNAEREDLFVVNDEWFPAVRPM